MNILKIAVLHTTMGRFGGAERTCILHTIHLKKAGYDADLYYYGYIPSTWKSMLEENGVNTLELPVSFKNLFLNTSGIINIVSNLKKYDLILIHHHIDILLMFILTRLYGGKILWYCGEPLRAIWEDYVSNFNYTINRKTCIITSEKIYGPLFSRFLEHNYGLLIKLTRLVDLSSVRRVKQIVTNSYFTKKVVENIYGVINAKVVYPGVETKLYTQCSSGIIKPSESRLIVSVGALIPVKNQARLIQALKRLEHMNIDFKCYIIGHGPERENLLTQIGNSRNIVILSNIDDTDLCKIYARARFVAHLALAEPFGLVPLEAALFNRPSVVSKNGGTSEFVINGFNGLTVDPLNLDEITNAMKTMLENDDLVDKMGYNAKIRVLNEFTAEKSVQSLIRIIEESMV